MAYDLCPWCSTGPELRFNGTGATTEPPQAITELLPHGVFSEPFSVASTVRVSSKVNGGECHGVHSPMAFHGVLAQRIFTTFEHSGFPVAPVQIQDDELS